MFLNRLPTRISLVVAVLAMATLGLVLTVVTGRIYRDHAIDNERAALADQVSVEVERLQRRWRREAEVVARPLGGLAALSRNPAPSPVQVLGELSRSATGHPHLVEIALYDAQLELRAAYPITDPALDEALWQAACAHLRPRLEPGAPIRPFGGYCLAVDRLYYRTYLPITRPSVGYLAMTIDAASGIASVERAADLPLRVLSDDLVIYQSPNWPGIEASTTAVVESHRADALSNAPIVFQGAREVSGLYARLEQTRYAVFFTAAAVTLLAALIVLAFLERTTLGPLRSLIDRLRTVGQDESLLGQRIEPGGNAEATELADHFNEMTNRVEELYENLERMAFTDPLTQLPNRHMLQDRLEKAVVAARRDNKTFALLLMDLDRFKEINGTVGHPIGDLLLQEVAVRLRAKLRESDLIARAGGDEFAVLLPIETPKQADTAARMLLQSLRAPFDIESHHLDIHTSIGIAVYPDNGVDAQTLIQRADIAMYAAKQAGCGHLFYEPHMDRHRPAQLALLGELRQAVDQEQFVLYYQPKIGLKTNRVVGLEALVRWRHPSGKLVMPETFIPLLEQTGLIRSLTGWVTHEALAMARELRDRGFELPIAVNISARDLQNSGLAEELAEQLGVHQALPQWLELEITESAVMADISSAMSLLTQLAGMGFRLVIDDFGTGYSSLAYLKRLPVHSVKIDKSFVMGMVKDDNDAAIVYTSIDLSHNLGLQVVAEGVDDEGVLFRLRSRGCDAVQGIYLSRPLPPEDLLDWLAKSSWGFQAQAAS